MKMLGLCFNTSVTLIQNNVILGFTQKRSVKKKKKDEPHLLVYIKTLIFFLFLFSFFSFIEKII